MVCPDFTSPVFSLYAITAFGRAPPAEVPIFKISMMAFSSSCCKLVLNEALLDNTFLAISTKLFTSSTKAFWLSFMVLGSNVKAPIPRLPIKHNISTGFMSSCGRPCCASHIFINWFPYLSGSTSASKPGKPLKVSKSAFLFLRNSGKFKILREVLMGIFNGAKSQFSFLNLLSYSKPAMPVFSSQATAPTNSSHIFTNAVFIFYVICYWLFYVCIFLVWPIAEG